MKSSVIALVLLASVTVTRATITNAWLYATDANMTCGYTWSTPDSLLTLVGTQNYALPAVLSGHVYTDVSGDPTLNLNQSINNQSGPTWTDYHVQISMPQPFTFLNVGVTNAGWTFTINPVVGNVGSIDYVATSSAADIAPGGELGFFFSLNWSTGATSFTETDTPSFVPEPGEIGLATVGGLLMLVARARRKR